MKSIDRKRQSARRDYVSLINSGKKSSEAIKILQDKYFLKQRAIYLLLDDVKGLRKDHTYKTR